MGKTIVAGLTSEQVIYYQDQLKALIEKSLDYAGDDYYTPEELLQKCVDGEYDCWVACSEPEKIDCIILTYIDVFPRKKELVIYLVGGDKMDSWFNQAWELMRQIAEIHNCETIFSGGRDGWIRKMQKIEPELKKRTFFTVNLNA